MFMWVENLGRNPMHKGRLPDTTLNPDCTLSRSLWLTVWYVEYILTDKSGTILRNNTLKWTSPYRKYKPVIFRWRDPPYFLDHLKFVYESFKTWFDCTCLHLSVVMFLDTYCASHYMFWFQLMVTYCCGHCIIHSGTFWFRTCGSAGLYATVMWCWEASFDGWSICSLKELKYQQ